MDIIHALEVWCDEASYAEFQIAYINAFERQRQAYVSECDRDGHHTSGHGFNRVASVAEAQLDASKEALVLFVTRAFDDDGCAAKLSELKNALTKDGCAAIKEMLANEEADQSPERTQQIAVLGEALNASFKNFRTEFKDELASIRLIRGKAIAHIDGQNMKDSIGRDEIAPGFTVGEMIKVSQAVIKLIDDIDAFIPGPKRRRPDPFLERKCMLFWETVMDRAHEYKF